MISKFHDKRKNKKVYNFTEKQRRRDRSLGAIHFHTVSHYSKIQASKKLRRKNSRILRQVFLGNDLPFVRYRKYMWWDW